MAVKELDAETKKRVFIPNAIINSNTVLCFFKALNQDTFHVEQPTFHVEQPTFYFTFSEIFSEKVATSTVENDHQWLVIHRICLSMSFKWVFLSIK